LLYLRFSTQYAEKNIWSPVISTENLNEKIGEGIILIEKRRIQMQGM
jgi:hypothetical protein